MFRSIERPGHGGFVLREPVIQFGQSTHVDVAVDPVGARVDEGVAPCAGFGDIETFEGRRGDALRWVDAGDFQVESQAVVCPLHLAVQPLEKCVHLC